MAYISFNDGETRVVRSVTPAPGDRFRDWVPTPIIIGPRHHALGSGIPYVVEHRTDYKVQFSIHQIRPADLANVVRLARWVGLGGIVSIFTEDLSGRAYQAYMGEGDDPPMLSPPDDEYLHDLQCSFMVYGSPYIPICNYNSPDMPSIEVMYDPGYVLTFARAAAATYISGP